MGRSLQIVSLELKPIVERLTQPRAMALTLTEEAKRFVGIDEAHRALGAASCAVVCSSSWRTPALSTSPRRSSIAGETFAVSLGKDDQLVYTIQLSRTADSPTLSKESPATLKSKKS